MDGRADGRTEGRTLGLAFSRLGEIDVKANNESPGPVQ